MVISVAVFAVAVAVVLSVTVARLTDCALAGTMFFFAAVVFAVAATLTVVFM